MKLRWMPVSGARTRSLGFYVTERDQSLAEGISVTSVDAESIELPSTEARAEEDASGDVRVRYTLYFDDPVCIRPFKKETINDAIARIRAERFKKFLFVSAVQQQMEDVKRGSAHRPPGFHLVTRRDDGTLLLLSQYVYDPNEIRNDEEIIRRKFDVEGPIYYIPPEQAQEMGMQVFFRDGREDRAAGF